jgi:hypothetical protein
MFFIPLLVALAAAQPMPPPAVSPPAAEAASQEVQRRYDAARERFLSGDLDGAARAFAEVAGDPTAGPLAAPARALADVARELSLRGRFVLRAPGAAADRGGRGELILYSTVYGIWVGDAIGVLANVGDPKAYALLSVGGGAAGAGLAAFLTRTGPMSEGRASTIDSAATWGTFNGAMIAALSDADGRGVVGAAVAGGLASLATAALVTSERAPSAGSAALASSGGIWGLGAGLLSLAVLGDSTAHTQQLVVLGAADLGLVAGAVVGSRIEISRGHVLILDAGAVLGTLAGLAVPLIADDRRSGAYGVAGLCGLGAGVATAAWLSRDWEAPETRVSAAPVVMRLPGGAVAAGIRASF